MYLPNLIPLQLSPSKSSEDVIQLKPVEHHQTTYPSLKLTEPTAYPSSLTRGAEPLYPTNMKGIDHASSLKSLETTAYSVKTLEPLAYPATTTTSSSTSSAYPSTTSYHPSFPDSTPDSYFQPCQIFQVLHLCMSSN